MSTVGWRCCKSPALRAIYEAVFLTMYHQGWNLSKQGPNVQKGLGPTNQTFFLDSTWLNKPWGWQIWPNDLEGIGRDSFLCLHCWCRQSHLRRHWTHFLEIRSRCQRVWHTNPVAASVEIPPNICKDRRCKSSYPEGKGISTKSSLSCWLLDHLPHKTWCKAPKVYLDHLLAVLPASKRWGPCRP